MITLKCKMCGGDLSFMEGAMTCECEYCGSVNTLPALDNRKQRANLYNRANRLRMQCEFDKALAAYEKILDQDNTDAEAHWGAVLSRWGIEYVKDPVTGERKPTCHRVQMQSILTDVDYRAALEHAPDNSAKKTYEAEAKCIAEIQKDILAISQQEKPYDVFICYKETDENGRRTKDSTLAQDIYYQLTGDGYKVFFSRITLEDKLGQQYEPYIFAALNSAKVMLAIGTKPEYFEAVWVKNEWSRYLHLMQSDRNRLLIPCFRDMDAYDLPEALSNLQSQDMSKIGFMQDVLRGVKKILDVKNEKLQSVVQQVQVAPQQTATVNATVESLMKRAKLFMEDGDFRSANEYLEKVLDIDPEYAPAYLGKVQSALRLTQEEQLAQTPMEYENTNDWKKALRFATPEQAVLYQKYLDDSKKLPIYSYAIQLLTHAITAEEYEAAAYEFQKIHTFKDAEAQIKVCEKKAHEIRERTYERALDRLNTATTVDGYEAAENDFKALFGFRDSAEKAKEAREKKEALEAQIRTEKERIREEERQRTEANNKRTQERNFIIFVVALLVVLVIMIYVIVIKPPLYYSRGKSKLAAGKYNDAYYTFLEVGDYKDAATMAQESMYQKGTALLEAGDYDGAATAFKSVTGYSDAATMAQESMYQKGTALLEAGDYDGAATAFKSVTGYSDAATMALESIYQKGTALLAEGEYVDAYLVFTTIKGYSDVDSLLVNDRNLVAAPAAIRDAEFSVGEYVTFGSYPQTVSGTDDTPIEWKVLARDGSNALLISRYALDCQPYDESEEDVTWESCTLRNWLNDNFLNRAFSPMEQKGILTSKVTADGNLWYSTNPGNDTQDKVFLLSINETMAFDHSDSFWICYPTDYADAQGVRTHDDGFEPNGACWWWLRTPGDNQAEATYIGPTGGIVDAYSCPVDYGYLGVRPALLINLDSGIF